MAGRVALVIPRAGTGPVVTPLHSAGVDGYAHRYLPSRQGIAAGSALSTLTDLGSAKIDLASTGLGSAVIQTANGLTYAELTSDAGTSANYIMEGATAVYAPQVTIAAVVQVDTGPARLYESEALGLIKATDGRYQASRSNGTSGAALIAGSAAGAWAFVLAQVDASALTLLVRKDTGEVSGTISNPQVGATRPRLGGNGGSASKVARVAEALTWNRVLTADERTAVHTAMRAQYPVLP